MLSCVGVLYLISKYILSLVLSRQSWCYMLIITGLSSESMSFSWTIHYGRIVDVEQCQS